MLKIPMQLPYPSVVLFVLSCTQFSSTTAQSLDEPLRFNTDGFERCIFNLVYHEGATNKTSSLDVLDRIISSQETQLWTISNVILEGPIYLKEACSINIIVALDSCHVYSLLRIFGNRQFSPDNLFAFIFVRKPVTCPLIVPIDFQMLVPADGIIMELSQNSTSV